MKFLISNTICYKGIIPPQGIIPSQGFIPPQGIDTIHVGTVVVTLQLLIQSVPIPIKVVSLNPVHGEVYSIQHYVI
jgi:hypothetical protein